MVGSIFAIVLDDLKREGMSNLASKLEDIKTRRMRNSVQPWGWQALERQWTWCGHLVLFPPSRLARVVASSFDDGMI